MFPKKNMNNAPCKLQIYRPEQYPNKLRSYPIFVDDEKVNTIKNGDKKILYLSPGTHTVWTKIDWLKSNKEQFEINSGETIKVEIGLHTISRFKKYLYFCLFFTFILSGAAFMQISILIGGALMGFGGFIFGLATSRPHIYIKNN